jgi:hypothetical protein
VVPFEPEKIHFAVMKALMRVIAPLVSAAPSMSLRFESSPGHCGFSAAARMTCATHPEWVFKTFSP